MKSLSKIMSLLSILLALPFFQPISAQEKPLSPEEFLSSYLSALQNQDQNRMQELIKDNLAVVPLAVNALLEQNIQLELSGKPDKAKESLLQASQIASDYQTIFNDSILSKQVALYQEWSLEDKQKKVSADTLFSEGEKAYYQGVYPEALNKWEGALKLYKEIRNQSREGASLGNLGRVYTSTGQYETALDFYQQALVIYKEIGNRVEEGIMLTNLAAIYGNQGQYEKALDFYQEALGIHTEIGNQEGIWLSNLGIARSLEALEKYPETVGYYETAVQTLESLREGFGSEIRKVEALANDLSVYQDLVRLLLRLHGEEPSKGYAEKAFEYVEQSKVQAFLSQLIEAESKIQKGIDPQLLGEIKDLYTQLHIIRESLKTNLAKDPRLDLQNKEKALRKQLEALQQELQKKNPLYAELKYPQPIQLKEVQTRLLQEGEVLLEYFLGEKESYLFIIDRGGFYVLTLPIGKPELVDRIKTLLIPFRQTPPAKNMRTFVETLNQFNLSLAHELYRQLIEPAEIYLKEARSELKTTPTLLIVPDSVLYYLPFEMLVVQWNKVKIERTVLFSEYKGLTFLIHRYPIVYAPSASVLKPEMLYHAREERSPAKTFLGVAPLGEALSETATDLKPISTRPQLSEDLLSTLIATEAAATFFQRPLPFSGKEVQVLGELFKPESLSIFGEGATETVIQSQMKDYRYIHLSTHGLLDSRYPMHSGLMFRDGFLQTHEVLNLELQADLVVLSASQTGLGELRQGEGIIGLVRAFMYAGTPSVLMSLWQVHDASTVALTTGFYRELKIGASKVDALRQARLVLLQQQKEVGRDRQGNNIYLSYAHPFFWAPFVLFGDWRGDKLRVEVSQQVVSQGASGALESKDSTIVKEGQTASVKDNKQVRESQKDRVVVKSVKTIKRIQESLKRMGFDPGRIDGDIGKKTRAALKAFQKEKGLKPTGEVTERTLEALGVQ